MFIAIIFFFQFIRDNKCLSISAGTTRGRFLFLGFLFLGLLEWFMKLLTTRLSNLSILIKWYVFSFRVFMLVRESKICRIWEPSYKDRSFKYFVKKKKQQYMIIYLLQHLH